MIVKQADDKQPQLDILRDLLTHPDGDAGTKKRIEQEIRNIQAGVRGEAEAAYEMQVHYGASKNWVIINDLRIEHDGLVAQIDHLLINRLMDVWVCESKHFTEGIAINDHGEFSAFFGSKPYGVPSPIEQNNKHILILQRFFNSGAVKLPSRLGFTIKPSLRSMVLVSKKARISRPKNKIDGLDCIVKNDQMCQLIDKVMDGSNPLIVAKLIGLDTLEGIARNIVSHHKPIQFNWAAKFGLSTNRQGAAKIALVEDMSTMEPAQLNQETATAPPATENKKNGEPQITKKKLICSGCEIPITYTIAKFCWFNKKRFNGEIYCMECQKKF